MHSRTRLLGAKIFFACSKHDLSLERGLSPIRGCPVIESRPGAIVQLELLFRPAARGLLCLNVEFCRVSEEAVSHRLRETG